MWLWAMVVSLSVLTRHRLPVLGAEDLQDDLKEQDANIERCSFPNTRPYSYAVCYTSDRNPVYGGSRKTTTDHQLLSLLTRGHRPSITFDVTELDIPRQQESEWAQGQNGGTSNSSLPRHDTTFSTLKEVTNQTHTRAKCPNIHTKCTGTHAQRTDIYTTHNDTYATHQEKRGTRHVTYTMKVFRHTKHPSSEKAMGFVENLPSVDNFHHTVSVLRSPTHIPMEQCTVCAQVTNIPVEQCTECALFNIMATRGTVTLTQLTDNMALPSHGSCVFLIKAPPGHFIQIKQDNPEYPTVHQAGFIAFDTVDGQIYITRVDSMYQKQPVYQSNCDQLYMKVSVGNEQLKPNTPRLKLHYETIHQLERAKLPVIFISQDQGYVTSPGFDGVTPYPASVNASADLHPLPNHVVMVSFPHFDLDDPRYNCSMLYQHIADDYLNVYELNNHTAKLSFRQCGSAAISPKVYTTAIRLHFVTGNYHSNIGFKMLFSFHPLNKAPLIMASGLLHCSVSHYASFKQHVHCNLEVECQGGQDEMNCPFSHPACNGSLGYQDLCYKLVCRQHKLTWNQANRDCVKDGGRLASLSSEGKMETFNNLFHFSRRRGALYVGGSNVDHDIQPFLYDELFQWSDRTMAYYINISTYFQSSYSRELRGCLLYHHHYSHSVFFFVECDDLAAFNFLCEYNVKSLQADTAHQAQNINFSLVSFRPIAGISTQLCPEHHVTFDFLSCDPASRCGMDVYLSTCSVPGQGVMAKFVCDNSRETLPYTLVCDFRKDCGDGSDEDFCHHRSCTERTCTNGQCVMRKHWCDTVNDCIDGSDEEDCSIERNFINNIPPYERRWAPPPAIVDLNDQGNIEVRSLQADKQCPETHFLCPSSYCLPVYVRCNYVYDCPGHEDEAGCQQYMCPGFYRCRASSVCVHAQHICDGLDQCPQQDDEWMCARNLTCPEGCRCQGLAFVCTNPFAARLYHDLRYLDASTSGMKLQDIKNNFYIVHLSLSANNISTVPHMPLPNLRLLDLSQNKLLSVSMNVFVSLKNLLELSVAGNPLVSVLETRSVAMHSQLLALDLSHTLLQEVHSEWFAGFTALQTLNVSHSRLHTIGSSGFSFIPTLRVLDISGNQVRHFPPRLFHGLSGLTLVRTSNYRLCCRTALPDQFNSRLCTAPKDEVSSCEDLLTSGFHHTWLWLTFLISVGANAGCVVVRFWVEGHLLSAGHSLLLTSLNLAHLLMSAPLGLILTAHLVFRRRYLQHEDMWRAGVGCQSVGFMSTLSAVASAFSIFGLTVERAITLHWPARRLQKSLSACCVCVVWVVGVMCAAIHVHLTSLQDIYHQSGLCLPLPCPLRHSGWYLGVVNIVNPVLHVPVCLGQAVIYWSARGHIMISDMAHRTRDRLLAWRLVPVAVSNSLCWMSVGLLTLMAVSGTYVSDQVNVATAIFVLPVNAALSPCLYLGHMWLETRRAIRERRLLHWLHQRAQHTKRLDLDPSHGSSSVRAMRQGDFSSCAPGPQLCQIQGMITSREQLCVENEAQLCDSVSLETVDDALTILCDYLQNNRVTISMINTYILAHQTAVHNV